MNEERVEDMVENVVHSLPGIKKLQLGNWESTPKEERVVAIWGKAFHWEKEVECRHRNKMEKQLAQQKQVAQQNQQYTWNGDRRGQRPHNDFSSLVDNALAAAKSGNGKQNKKRGGRGRKGGEGSGSTVAYTVKWMNGFL